MDLTASQAADQAAVILQGLDADTKPGSTDGGLGSVP